MSTTEHHSKEHSKDTKHSKETQHSTDTKAHKHYEVHQHKDQETTHHGKTTIDEKHYKEHETTHQPTVVIERVQNAPVLIENHHHHTHTIIHPEIVREHNTTEIRQIVQPIHEHLSGEKVEYAGEHVKVIERSENVEAAQKIIDAHNRDIQAKADVTHTKEHTMSIDSTKEKDVHTGHKVIEEVTPVIIRDVDHHKTIHKDEKLVEHIHHAPEVIKEEKEMVYKEGHTKDSHGLKHKEGYTKEEHHIKEGHTKDTIGLKEEHTKETRLRKDEVPAHGHGAKPDH